MFLLEPVITQRVRAAIAGLAVEWTVMGKTTDEGRRDAAQLASVAFFNGNVADTKAGGVSLETAWRITLSKRRGADTAEALDGALSAVIAALHDWPPETVSGRQWGRLRLAQVVAPQYPEDALEGVHLVFITSARFNGHR